MGMPSEHTALLQRGGYPISPTGGFDDRERDILARYGYWMEALAAGDLTPTTAEQRRFVRVARGEEAPESAFELVWVKHQRTTETTRPQVGPLEVSTCLERLHSARAAAAAVQEEYDSMRSAIMEQVRPLLEALDAEFEERLRATGEGVSRRQVEAREAVLAFGASFRHAGVHAVYARGRVTWDTPGLVRYAETHPEVAEFRRVGEPSVSLRVQPLPESQLAQRCGQQPHPDRAGLITKAISGEGQTAGA